MPSCMINGREMHYLDQGEGFPLLFGHCYLWDSRVWQNQFDFLSKYFRCIAPDAWSHGQSEVITEYESGLDQLVEDNRALMQHLEIERYSIVGLALGAIWGSRLAIKYPDEVASLTMMAGTLEQERPETAQFYKNLMSSAGNIEELHSSVIDAVVKIYFCSQTQERHPALVETFRFDLMFLTPEQVKGVVALGLEICNRTTIVTLADQIRCPTLILSGDSDLVRPAVESNTMHDLLPGSQFAVIEEAGHMLPMEQPSKVNQLLANFLSSIDGVELDLRDAV
ncbi:alpha/beta fold hydrolase [Amphritea balenae]|uniref:Alpha/beta hydrolase n=1 Tax=Amphritea balenae TaxID=452629 RepID=A0A3P1SS54_9GAMM|nr:alpha/beta hydrolase [Amphritea balenae]RRD00014.1 alpha/beta hydrolase [Amphritea balenae]GGK75860.1 2-succinyl-6-hydroxy-2,4-cyclohexadiene-1-carboxylate synthase [Amphritea balenae]